jgi:hypothetical protein
LKQARERRDDARRLLAAGIDPSSQRQAEKLATNQEAGSSNLSGRTNSLFLHQRVSLGLRLNITGRRTELSQPDVAAKGSVI